jgi:hypothetical protein
VIGMEGGAARRSPVGAIRCKAPRQGWHSRHARHCQICNLQNPKRLTEFESHPLRHSVNRSYNDTYRSVSPVLRLYEKLDTCGRRLRSVADASSRSGTSGCGRLRSVNRCPDQAESPASRAWQGAPDRGRLRCRNLERMASYASSRCSGRRRNRLGPGPRLGIKRLAGGGADRDA